MNEQFTGWRITWENLRNFLSISSQRRTSLTNFLWKALTLGFSCKWKQLHVNFTYLLLSNLKLNTVVKSHISHLVSYFKLPAFLYLNFFSLTYSCMPTWPRDLKITNTTLMSWKKKTVQQLNSSMHIVRLACFFRDICRINFGWLYYIILYTMGIFNHKRNLCIDFWETDSYNGEQGLETSLTVSYRYIDNRWWYRYSILTSRNWTSPSSPNSDTQA